jgi:hypothetical protein
LTSKALPLSTFHPRGRSYSRISSSTTGLGFHFARNLVPAPIAPHDGQA